MKHATSERNSKNIFSIAKNCRLEEEKLQSFDDQNELQGDFVSKVDFVIP